jgi:Domain of unknown function (DUF4926)
MAVTDQARIDELQVVALLVDHPLEKLQRGQVGTVVARIDEHTVLVEFSHDGGNAFALAPFAITDVLVLRCAPLELSPPGAKSL